MDKNTKKLIDKYYADIFPKLSYTEKAYLLSRIRSTFEFQLLELEDALTGLKVQVIDSFKKSVKEVTNAVS